MLSFMSEGDSKRQEGDPNLKQMMNFMIQQFGEFKEQFVELKNEMKELKVELTNDIKESNEQLKEKITLFENNHQNLLFSLDNSLNSLLNFQTAKNNSDSVSTNGTLAAGELDKFNENKDGKTDGDQQKKDNVKQTSIRIIRFSDNMGLKMGKGLGLGSIESLKSINKDNLQTELENAVRNEDGMHTPKSNTSCPASGHGPIQGIKFCYVMNLSWLNETAFQQEYDMNTTRATGMLLTLNGSINYEIEDRGQDTFSFNETKEMYIKFKNSCDVPQTIFTKWEYYRGEWKNNPNRRNDQDNFLQLILTDDTGHHQFKIIVKNYGRYDAEISYSKTQDEAKIKPPTPDH